MRGRHGKMMTALKRYEESQRTIQTIVASKEGQKMLVPMTDSLFVEGELADLENVTVEIGTGFFVKRTIPDAEDYLKRQIKKLNEILERVGVNILAQESNLAQVEEVFQLRLRQAREQTQT